MHPVSVYRLLEILVTYVLRLVHLEQFQRRSSTSRNLPLGSLLPRRWPTPRSPRCPRHLGIRARGNRSRPLTECSNAFQVGFSLTARETWLEHGERRRNGVRGGFDHICKRGVGRGRGEEGVVEGRGEGR